MNEPLTKAFIAAQFSRLRQHIRQPDVGNMDTFLDDYLRLCGYWPPDAFRLAVDAYLAASERHQWPLPGTLARLCREQSAVLDSKDTLHSRYRRWQEDPWRNTDTADESDPCPVCGATWTYRRWVAADQSGRWTDRLTIRHDPIAHMRTSTAWSDVPLLRGWVMATYDSNAPAPVLQPGEESNDQEG